MNFKDFYNHIYFNVDSRLQGLYKAKQGDTKSRGFYVTLIVNNKKIPVTNQSLYFYCLKPDGTKVFAEAVKDEDIFRLDLPNQVFAVAGELKCELTLRGPSGEQISTQTFTMRVEKSLQDDSIISEDERGIIDDAFELIDRLENIDIDIDELETLKSELEQSEVIRESQEFIRESNEALRIALYDDLLSKVASGFFKGEKGDTGKGLEYTWNGTQLGVRVEGTTEYVYVDLKGEKGDTGNIENLDAQLITDALGYIPLPVSGGTLENYSEKLTTVSASGGNIDLSLGNVFVHTPSGNRTYSITNAVNGEAHSFTLIINMGSTVRTLTFPSSVKWQNGEIPDLTTPNKTYVLTFMTVDGGTNWLGMFGGEF